MAKNFKMLRSKYNEDENLIFKYRLDHGLSQKELALLCDTNYQNIRILETGEQSPLMEKNFKGFTTGSLRPVAEKLCTVFNVAPAELFPRYFCSLKKQELSINQKLNITCGEWRKFSVMDEIMNKEKKILIWAAINQLDSRLITVISLRIFDEKTLKEVGEVLGVSKDRIRQLEGRAFRFLRILITRSFKKCGQISGGN